MSEQVHLLGYRKDIPELNHAADVFCFPSLREGLGLAAIEAMACGIPAVVADNRGTRSFVSDGQNGYICESGSADGFAAAVGALMNDPQLKKALSEKACNTTARFSEEAVLKEMKKIYADCKMTYA